VVIEQVEQVVSAPGRLVDPGEVVDPQDVHVDRRLGRPVDVDVPLDELREVALDTGHLVTEPDGIDVGVLPVERAGQVGEGIGVVKYPSVGTVFADRRPDLPVGRDRAHVPAHARGADGDRDRLVDAVLLGDLEVLGVGLRDGELRRQHDEVRTRQRVPTALAGRVLPVAFGVLVVVDDPT